MRNLPLNQSRVDRLKPRNTTYDIRDTDLKGFGIRVLPSGKKSYFLQTQHEGQRRWTKIGDADAMSEAETRSQARSLLAGIRKGRESIPDLPPADFAFEAVADEVFSYYRRHWKPRTLAVNLNYYKNNILPWFKGRPIAGITRPGGAGMVRVPSCEASLGEPISAGAIGHPVASRGVRIQAGGQQSLQRHQTLPSPCAGTLPVAGRNSPRRRGSEPV